MKRLRHPVRAIREPFGTAGLVVACIALILALTGAAFAATGLNGKQKKEVEKIAKKFAGKPGAPGAQGPAGPAGANGKDGANGAAGEKGATGATGSQGAAGSAGSAGADGKSVVSEAVLPEPGGECGEEVGGVEYEVEESGEPTVICNGEEGPQGPAGPEGVCSTTSCVLPHGVVEAAVWAVDRPEIAGDETRILVPFSFPIPLQSGLFWESESGAPTPFHYAEDPDFRTFCGGTANKPQPVNSNELCIYQGELEGTTFQAVYGENVFGGAGTQALTRYGGVLSFTVPTGDARGLGTVAIRG